MCFLEQTLISVPFIAGIDFTECRVSDTTTLYRDEIVSLTSRPVALPAGAQRLLQSWSQSSLLTAIKTFLCWPLLLEGCFLRLTPSSILSCSSSRDASST